ncbi:D-alanyl-lipoteichoic acid biosynthesis protein DltD [Candidatus Binatia bacterium]|nr:D-alanyl-lipoteichoic acid biosynthesis protein DltD [Candidatus Binatia bacterium]
MRQPRLAAASAALVVFAAAVAASAAYARRAEIGAVHALAPQMFAQKMRGIALQQAAFRQPDLLPIYGSSELNVPNEFHSSALFRSYPRGFTVFPVGNPGSTSLIWLQALAAVGGDLEGKKVALFLSPRPFMTPTVDRHAYAANFSPLQANELVFSSRLSFGLKQEVARRLQQYPATLAGDRLLRFAIERLADGSVSSRFLYYASWPLGAAHCLVLRLADHWENLAFLRARGGSSPVPRQGAELDWPALLGRAERESERAAGRNPFGFESGFWAAHAAEIARQKGAYASPAAAPDIEGSAEWKDLELLLRVIGDLGGRPFLLNAPFNGTYYDYLGVPLPARRAYYDRLLALADAYGVPAMNFADRDTDPYFTADPMAHLSGKGWVHYGRALDAFFHDRPAAGDG